MIFLFALGLIGTLSIKTSLDAIQQNTRNMEQYTFEMHEKTKKLEKILDIFKRCLVEIQQQSLCD